MLNFHADTRIPAAKLPLALNQHLPPDIRDVVLGHLSKENNYEELAYETVRLEISIGDNPYKGNDIPMMVAKRDQVSDIIAL